MFYCTVNAQLFLQPHLLPHSEENLSNLHNFSRYQNRLPLTEDKQPSVSACHGNYRGKAPTSDAETKTDEKKVALADSA